MNFFHNSTITKFLSGAVICLLGGGSAYAAATDYDFFAGPWIFSGYRELPTISFPVPETVLDADNWPYSDGLEYFDDEEQLQAAMLEKAETGLARTVAEDEDFARYYALLNAGEKKELLETSARKMADDYREALHTQRQERAKAKELRQTNTILAPGWVPDWLRRALISDRVAQNLMYSIMVLEPKTIDYAYWNLPVPPRLPEEDHSFAAFIRSMDLPEVEAKDSPVAITPVKKVHWLHNAMAGIQFSQAYVSANWYQGGNDYLALLLSGLWDVELNKVYHPDLLFQSSVSYKLGLNTTPPDSYHKYSISEDLLQWNLKTGLKAFRDFFWSYNLLFKTQLLRNYEANSDTRLASFLSPGELNMGIGMSYSYANKYKTLKLGLSLSPLSYNLKTCIDSKIDETRFNIKPGRKGNSEFGSNLEINVEWAVTSQINCRTRLFGFTDYHYCLGDLETTWDFSLNRFLSTQLYAHLRYDGSQDLTGSKWKHWMLKEILSFGLTYTFSTKP